jgi:hypothetical protein
LGAPDLAAARGLGVGKGLLSGSRRRGGPSRGPAILSLGGTAET